MTDKQIINGWLNDVQSDLVANYHRLGLRASGKWEESLESFVDPTQEGFSVGIKGQRYTGGLENGRKPNSNKSKEALKKWVGWAGSTVLKDWVQDKGLNINPYAVAWKIARSGWQVPNKHNEGGLVSDVVTTDRISQLNRELVFNEVSELRSDLIRDLK